MAALMAHKDKTEAVIRGGQDALAFSGDSSFHLGHIHAFKNFMKRNGRLFYSYKFFAQIPWLFFSQYR